MMENGGKCRKNWKNHEKAELKKTSENLGKKMKGKGGNAKMAD